MDLSRLILIDPGTEQAPAKVWLSPRPPPGRVTIGAAEAPGSKTPPFEASLALRVRLKRCQLTFRSIRGAPDLARTLRAEALSGAKPLSPPPAMMASCRDGGPPVSQARWVCQISGHKIVRRESECKGLFATRRSYPPSPTTNETGTHKDREEQQRSARDVSRIWSVVVVGHIQKSTGVQKQRPLSL